MDTDKDKEKPANELAKFCDVVNAQPIADMRWLVADMIRILEENGLSTPARSKDFVQTGEAE
jgi:hypothetical protein